MLVAAAVGASSSELHTADAHSVVAAAKLVQAAAAVEWSLAEAMGIDFFAVGLSSSAAASGEKELAVAASGSAAAVAVALLVVPLEVLPLVVHFDDSGYLDCWNPFFAVAGSVVAAAE